MSISFQVMRENAMPAAARAMPVQRVLMKRSSATVMETQSWEMTKSLNHRLAFLPLVLDMIFFMIFCLVIQFSKRSELSAKKKRAVRIKGMAGKPGMRMPK